MKSKLAKPCEQNMGVLPDELCHLVLLLIISFGAVWSGTTQDIWIQSWEDM